MTASSRRSFLIHIAAGGGALAATQVLAQSTAPTLSEADPQAVALGYRSDTTKVDKAKYPNHTPAQMCSGCSFYQGKPADAMAPCQLFGGKQVAGKGWCSAWAKKA